MDFSICPADRLDLCVGSLLYEIYRVAVNVLREEDIPFLLAFLGTMNKLDSGPHILAELLRWRC